MLSYTSHNEQNSPYFCYSIIAHLIEDIGSPKNIYYTLTMTTAIKLIVQN